MNPIDYKIAYDELLNLIFDEAEKWNVEASKGCDGCPIAYSCLMDNTKEISCKEWTRYIVANHSKFVK